MDTNNNEVTQTTTNNKGNRGEVGTATAGLSIRNLWRASGSNMRLKAFARQLLKGPDKDKALVAREWMSNKNGGKNAKRSDANIKAAIEASSKSKAKKK